MYEAIFHIAHKPFRDLPRIRTSVISPTTLWAHLAEIFTKGFDISQTVNNNENLLNQNYAILNPRPCAAKNNICALVHYQTGR